ncbi:MAG: division/cell wall cluster transcriptional repressor MraZ [Dehalococcoidia bacterium]|nr:division/cell wall cluster transcriptional repressor MraZ [Dehalococcoidia bacterium]
MDFRGTYEFTLDNRGRVSIPARYRHEFADKVILAMGQDGCVEVYTEDGFNQMSNHVAAEPPTTPDGRQARREFYAQSFDTELDRQGRILVPPRFREKAALNGAVVIAGRKECLEIWHPARLERLLRGGSSSTEQAPEG